MKKKIQIAIFSILVIFAGCENNGPNKHLIRLQLSGFVISGNGSRLDFPIFAEHISLKSIEETVQTAEEIHEKLSKLYSFKHFSLFELANWDGLISSEIEIQHGEPVFKNLVPGKYQTDFEVEVFFSSMKNEIGELTFRIDRKGSLNGGTKYQTVKLKSGQSVSIASLYREKGNSGLLYVLSMESLGSKGTPSKQSIRDFFENSKLNKSSKTPEQWTKLIHDGVEAISYSIRKNDPSLKPKDAPPAPPGAPKVKFVPYDEPPKPLSPIRPKYPEIAKEAGIEGTIVIQVLVGADGLVKDTQILKGIPNTGLDEAATEAVKDIKFKPAEKDGVPQEVWISIPINFKLNVPPGKAPPFVRKTPYDLRPEPLTAIRPIYPQKAKDAKIEGLILISVLVNEKGIVEETAVVKSIPNTKLDEAAIDAIKKTKFRPAQIEGKIQRVWINIPIHFRLPKD